MRTRDYVEKYKLDIPEYANHFNTDLFLQDLNKEFLERINKEKEARKKIRLEYSYRIFSVIIQEMQTKFCAISNKKSGGALRPELWNAFYAKYIIPVREKDFPEEHRKIQAKREAYEKSTIREAIIDEIGRAKYLKIKESSKALGDYRVFEKLKEDINAEVDKRYALRQKGKH